MSEKPWVENPDDWPDERLVGLVSVCLGRFRTNVRWAARVGFDPRPGNLHIATFLREVAEELERRFA